MLPNMKRHAIRTLVLALLASPVLAGGSGWERDMEKALKKAQKQERPLLVEFTDGTSSEAVNKNVFHKGKFKSWAKKNVVLVEIDFSKKVSKSLGEQYAELRKKYAVESFPTLLLLDGEGKVLSKLAYDGKMEVEPWLAELEEAVSAAGSAGEWLTDWEQAKKIAKRTKRPMLVDFTGSDW